MKIVKIKKPSLPRNLDLLFEKSILNVDCAEQPLPKGGICLLGAINLTQFIDFENQTWDYKQLKKIIPIAVRMMDNVNDITHVPLEVQKWNLQNKRRIGLGILGYGSSLMMLKVRYGSKKALQLTEELMSFFTNITYQSSALLAKEKGPFPLYNQPKYLESNFVKLLSEETKSLIKKYGTRNSHLLTIAPTGNSSVFANNVSGGLEPLFMPQYVRTIIMPYPPEGLDVPKNIDWENKKHESVNLWQWTKEGDENLLKIDYNNYTYKFDRNRGLVRETIVKDYAVRYLENIKKWTPEANWVATTTELTIDEHIETMKVFAKYIDSSLSKTTNLPNNYSFENFKDLYLNAHSTGYIKGITTYRAGTMTSVLAEVKNEKSVEKITKTNAPKRPKELSCDIHHLIVQGKPWLVLVGLYENDPYEVFVFKSKKIHLSKSIKQGKLIKEKRGVYNLACEDGMLLEDIKQLFETDEQEALTRMISTALRHGTSIDFIYQQLLKSEGTIVSFSKAVARSLKKYVKTQEVEDSTCPSCDQSDSLIFQEGCLKCKNCNYSKCS